MLIVLSFCPHRPSDNRVERGRVDVVRKNESWQPYQAEKSIRVSLFLFLCWLTKMNSSRVSCRTIEILTTRINENQVVRRDLSACIRLWVVVELGSIGTEGNDGSVGKSSIVLLLVAWFVSFLRQHILVPDVSYRELRTSLYFCSEISREPLHSPFPRGS